MKNIFRYSFFDLIRSRWTLIYGGFYLVLTFALIWLSGDLLKVITSLMNITLMLVPLIALLFSSMYYYHSRDFVELLLAQPLKRTHIFIGQYLGIAVSLGLSLLVGLGLPFLIFGVLGTSVLSHFFTLIGVNLMLTFIFVGLWFAGALRYENRIKGFGLGILIWLFFAVIYDGIVLLGLVVFRDYPLDHFALGASIFNPIDLSRILILLKLDISALMGYTGAVFQKFLGSNMGIMIAIGVLMLWVAIPIGRIRFLALRKDF